MFIRPVLDPASEIPGARLKIRDPDTMEFLPEAGAEKPDSEYWQRRLLLDRSVETIDAPIADEPAEPSAASDLDEEHRA